MSLDLRARTTPTQGVKWERVAIGALLVIQVLLVATLPVDGPFSIDEVVYTEMTRSLSSGHGLLIDNGYEEVPSPELMTLNMELTFDGHVTSQYPYGLPFLAAPLYSLFGVRGIMLLNAVAFVAVIALTFLIARHLLEDRRIAWMAAVVTGGATFMWQYSIAIWPHMLTVAFALGAVYAMLVAVDRPPDRTLKFAALSGLLFGCAVMNRLDAVLMFPAVACCLYRRRETWMRAAGGFVIGTIPSLVFLSVTNVIRWDTLLPFTYGSGSSLRPLLLIGMGTVTLLVVLIYSFAHLPTRLRKPAAIGVGIAVVALLVVPVTRRYLGHLAFGLWVLVVDLRQLPPSDEGALERLADGTLLYFGTVKKSLLQSLPYLVAILIPVIATRRNTQRRASLILLSAVAVYVGFYSARPWHGGLSFNLRYFLPLLPFAAILTAWAIDIVLKRSGPGDQTARTIRLSILVGLGVFAAGMLTFRSIPQTAWFLSTVPLVIAGATLVLVIVFLTRPSVNGSRALLGTIVIGLTWATAIAFSYDLIRTFDTRHENSAMSAVLATGLEDSSLLLTSWPDGSFGVKELRSGVVVAIPREDEFETAAEVVTTFHGSHQVVGALTPEDWEALERVYDGEWETVGQIRDYEIRELRVPQSEVSAEVER